MIERLTEMPPGTIGFRAAGEIEREDYDGDDLLAPTRLYLEDVRRLRAGTDVRALAHVTGGGIVGNLSRVLRDRKKMKAKIQAAKTLGARLGSMTLTTV
jgi:phosphoribosylaminoimidazole (AIR) synthetase